MAGAADRVFRQLTDADLKFGMCKNEKGESVELSHSSFSSFLRSPSRNVRRKAFHQYYAQFQGHENSLAAAYSSSVQKDVYYAKARNYPSAREGSLFHDNVPVAVYDNLIAAVRSKLPAVYKYLEVRRKKMQLRDIHHYDTYVPILSELDTKHTWKQAVDVVVESLEPLGDDYCRVLHDGLAGRWCDRYPNQGKRSGAFSSGSYDGWPVHPDELPARRARPRLHAGPRGRPLDAQLLLGQAPAVPVLQLHDLRRRGRQHVQRATAEPPPDEPRENQEGAGLPHQPRDRRHPRHDHPPNDVRRVREDHRTPWSKPASRSPSKN